MTVSHIFTCLRLAASSAAPAGLTDVTDKYESAQVWVTVASQVSTMPNFPGISVTPSGRLQSVPDKSAGC